MGMGDIGVGVSKMLKGVEDAFSVPGEIKAIQKGPSRGPEREIS